MRIYLQASGAFQTIWQQVVCGVGGSNGGNLKMHKKPQAFCAFSSFFHY